MKHLTVPNWLTLRRLGANSAVRSANIWALVVPVAARLLEGVQDVVTVKLFQHEFPIHFGLPFSWKVLFVSAIAFLFANIVYAIFCPLLIRETGAYRDFAEQKRSGAELAALLQQLAHVGQVDEDEAVTLGNWFSFRRGSFLDHQARQHQGFSRESDERGLMEAYATIVSALASANFSARLFASIFYALGMAALGVVIFQNICFVFRHW